MWHRRQSKELAHQCLVIPRIAPVNEVASHLATKKTGDLF